MSRRRWGPVRRHVNRYLLYYISGAMVLVLLIGAVVGVLLVLGGNKKVLKSPFGNSQGTSPDRNETVLAGQKGKAAEDALAVCHVGQVGLTVYLPGRYRDIMGIAYHEARTDKAFPLEPLGYLLKNDNVYKVDVALDAKTPLPTYYIMETRYEPYSATSACDIAMRDGAPVLAPVDGVVTKVKDKILYQYYDDTQVEIEPKDHPDVRVVLIHVKQVKLQLGDVVKRGEAVIGVPRDYREHFESEIDDYVKPAHPHVQIQLNRYVPEENEE